MGHDPLYSNKNGGKCWSSQIIIFKPVITASIITAPRLHVR